MAKVSIPEKTLEHWSSQYVTYRYRSKAAMWWPATGADIDVRCLPSLPGKAVQLELKTTVVAGSNKHDVMVNLGQLWDYWNLPLPHQPFYVFPWPDWSGDLEAVAVSSGVSPSELAFSRSGAGWWFADWMVVLTTAQVATVLRTELAAHGSSRRKNSSRRLVQFDMTSPAGSPSRLWGSGVAEPDSVPWRQFWTDLQACGGVGWPQLIRLPAALVVAHEYERFEVAALLAQARDWIVERERNVIELVTLGPSADRQDGEPEVFRVIDDPVGGIISESAEPTFEGSPEEDHRQIVFVEAGVGGRQRSPRYTRRP